MDLKSGSCPSAGAAARSALPPSLCCREQPSHGEALVAALLCQNKAMCVGITLLPWGEKGWK